MFSLLTVLSSPAAAYDPTPARTRWLAAEALQAEPSDPSRWVRLAATTDDPREALPLLEEALRLAPNDLAATVASARALDAIGRGAEAEELLVGREAVAARVALADLRGDPDPARQALATSPGDPDAALAVARWTRDPVEAAAALGSVAVADRRVEAARVERALRGGDPVEARFRVGALRTLDSTGSETERWDRWVVCLERGTVDAHTLGALLDARRTAIVDPTHPADVDALARAAPGCAAAQALRGSASPGDRVEGLRAAVALAPDDAGLVEDLGEALLAAHRPARTELTRARALRPSIPPTPLAQAMVADGDRDAAHALLDQEAPRFPDDPDLALVRAELTPERPVQLTILVDALERTSDPRLLARARELADALDRSDELAPVLRGPRSPPSTDPVSEEVVVIAKSSATRLAELEGRVHALGYTRDPERRGDGTVVFAAEAVDRPQIELHPDGQFDVQRSGVVPTRLYPWLEDQSPLVPRVISARKLGQQRDRVIAELQPSLTAWREALCAEGLEDRLLYEIPATLDRIWDDGVGRDGSVLATPDARRAELLDWWVTRTCTPEGLAVRGVIAGYLGDVVQRSPWPVTVAEVDGVNARRACDPPLALR